MAQRTSIPGSQIRDETITEKQIKDGSVESVDLSPELNQDIQAPLRIGDGLLQTVSVDIHEQLNIRGLQGIRVMFDDETNTISIHGSGGSFQSGSNVNIRCGTFSEPNAKISLGTFI